MRIQNIVTYKPYLSYANSPSFMSCINYDTEPEKLSPEARGMIEAVHECNKEMIVKGYDPLCFHAYYIPQKMDPILEGISVFEGLSMTEVGFILEHMTEIGILRGCYNNCAHCYAAALPPKKNSDEYVSRMCWEDYKDLTDGIKEINSRLGCITRCLEAPMLIFHDADCSHVYITDDEGNIHGCTELAKMMYDATKTPVILSTAGWYKNDTAAQQRMEQYVKEISEDDNLDYLHHFHISANPYHAMNYQVVKLKKEGKTEKAQFIHQKDVERMANVLFTLTPLLNTGKLIFISRAMSNGSKNSEGFSENDLKTLWEEYFNGLKELYEDDYKTEQKFIKNQEDIDINLAKYRELFDKVGIDTTDLITTGGRLSNIYDKDDPITVRTNQERLNNPKEAIHNYNFGIIDANGDFYLTNYYESYKTALKLNFKNKNKQTPPINPYLASEPITKELIKEWEAFFMDSRFRDVIDEEQD